MLSLLSKVGYCAGNIMEQTRIDNHFMTIEIKTSLKKQQIKITQPGPYKHGKNGIVEVLIKQILVAAIDATDLRKLLFSSKIPLVTKLWTRYPARPPKQHYMPARRDLLTG